MAALEARFSAAGRRRVSPRFALGGAFSAAAARSARALTVAGAFGVAFSPASSAVSLNFITYAEGGQAAGDEFLDVEWFELSGWSDSFVGGFEVAKADGGFGNDTLTGGQLEDTLSGGAGNDQLDGLLNDDHLFGEAGDDKLAGGGQDDFLSGMEGADTLIGGDGDDFVSGGLGRDVLEGGTGVDVFSLLEIGDSGPANAARDVVKDFNLAQQDRIDLSAIDADVGADGDQAFVLVSTFSGAAGRCASG